MKTDQKLGLTEGLLALVCALLIWQTQLLLTLSEEVARLQVHDQDQDRRIENLEDHRESSTTYLPDLRDYGADLPSAKPTGRPG
jgi:hypothetical protein